MRWFKPICLAALALAGAAAPSQAPREAATSIQPVARSAPPEIPVPGGGHALTREDVDSWLDGYLPYALRTTDIPGVTISIVKDGRLLTARGYGYADVAKRLPVDPARTLFRPGSVSKLVTWTAVMQQVEAGRLDLDRDINAYLDFRVPPYDGKPITLRQIMTHTAGFNEATKDVVYFAPKPKRTLEQYLKHALPARIYAPGTTPAYSNYATALAAYMVQRVAREEFDAYLERHIFMPLGMTSSTFRQPLPPALAPRMARGYKLGSEPAKPFEIVGPAPAGALSTTATDMARFMLAHLQDGTLDGHRILKPETARMMHQSPLDRVDAFSVLPPLNRMELGFFETNINGREVIGHLGDTEMFHTSLHLFPREGVGLYFSFNSPGKDGAVQPLRMAIFEDFADRYFPATAKDGRVDDATARRHAAMMVGHWDGSRRSEGSFFSLTSLLGQAKISLGPKGDMVVSAIVGPNGVPRRWIEIAPFVWRDADGHDELAARVVDGRVVRWSYGLPAPFEVFDRTPGSHSSAWILPCLIASLIVLALTFLYWPASWLVRRRYAASLAVTSRARGVYRMTRLFAGLDLALLGGWVLMLAAMIGDINNLTEASDPMLWLLQIAGLVIFFGAVILGGWNAWLAFRDGRRWTRRLWAVLVLLAALMVLYFAVMFGLVAMTVAY